MLASELNHAAHANSSCSKADSDCIVFGYTAKLTMNTPYDQNRKWQWGTVIRKLPVETMKDKQKASNVALTKQGLKLKGVEKIHRIRCDASYQDVVLQTWQFGRMVRRDFNLLAYKLFFAVRRDDQRRKIRHLFDSLVEEAEVLGALARRYELPKPSNPTTLNLRIVSDESLRLLEALQAADKALSTLKNSEMAEVAEENCTPFFVAYNRLKNTLLEAGQNILK